MVISDDQVREERWRNRKMNYEITELSKEEWEGTYINMDYIAEEYYDLELT